MTRELWVVERGNGEPVSPHWTEESANRARIRECLQTGWLEKFVVTRYVPEEER